MMSSDELFVPMPTAASLRQDPHWERLQARIDQIVAQSEPKTGGTEFPAPARRQRRNKTK